MVSRQNADIADTLQLEKFLYIWTITLVLLYKAMVRPHLEYANCVWCLYAKGDT